MSGAQNAAVKNMHTKLTEAFKKVFWPEGVTKDGDMTEYFDAVAQLWAYNKVRQAEAQGVSVESMMGDIEVVNDGNGNVNIVLRHGKQRQETQTQAAPTTETTAEAQPEAAPTAETQSAPEESVVASFGQDAGFVIYDDNGNAIDRTALENIVSDMRSKKPDVLITGRELGDFGLSVYQSESDNPQAFAQLRKAAMSAYENLRLSKTPAKHPVLGNVQFTNAGREKTIVHSHEVKKMMAIAKIKDIIEAGRYIGWGENFNPNKSNVKRFLYMLSSVSIMGQNEEIFVTLQEDNNGKLHYNLNFDGFDSSRAPHWVSESSSASGNPGSTREHGDNIADEDINIKFKQDIDGTVRGKTDFYREQTIIGVFKTGDKSTLLHELGHVFLQELSEFAKMEGVSQDVREDWDKISAWLGISDIDPAHPMDDEQKARWRNAHEKFAAHFEAYLMEGVAPTEELKSVFRRFKEWLCRIYQAADRTVCIALRFYLSHSKNIASI